MKLLLAFIFVFMLSHKNYCQNKLIYGFDLNAGVSNFVLNKSSTLYTDKAKNWANANISYDPQLAYGINLVAEYQLNNLLSIELKPGFMAWGAKNNITSKLSPPSTFSVELTTYYLSLEFPLYVKYTFLQKDKYKLHTYCGGGIMHTFSGDFDVTTQTVGNKVKVKPNLNFQTYYASIGIGSNILLSKKTDLVIGIQFDTDAFFDSGRFHDFGGYFGIDKMPINYYMLNLNLGIRLK